VRRVLAVVLVLVCAADVVAYQGTRPGRAAAGANVFVPSPRFFLDFSPSFRTSVADAYYLRMIQYYGEHVKSGQLASLPAMADLVTTLSPHFRRPYLFGAFALLDVGRPDLSVKLLKKGLAANPDDWSYPSYLGYFAYQYGQGTKRENELAAAAWYTRAAALPGAPPLMLRLAAVLSGKGGDLQKAVVMWGQVYSAGDKYSHEKAVAGLERILPKDKTARMKALAPLVQTMAPADLRALVADLFAGYPQ
jgi:hypothetical protein